jgi:hypothetical protein
MLQEKQQGGLGSPKKMLDAADLKPRDLGARDRSNPRIWGFPPIMMMDYGLGEATR